MRCRRRTISGFTLLELVLVLTILAVVLAAIVPTLSGFAAGRKPQDAAAQFVALAHYARSQAIADGTTYRIVLNPQQGQWWLSGEDSGNNPVAGPYGRVFQVPEGVSLDTDAPKVDGVPTLHFEPNGRSEPAAVRFVGARTTVQVECVLPIDEFHVVTSGG